MIMISVVTNFMLNPYLSLYRAETMVAPQAAIRRTVDDILQNFKAAGRIQRATLNRSAGVGSSVSSSMSLGFGRSSAADVAGKRIILRT